MVPPGESPRWKADTEGDGLSSQYKSPPNFTSLKAHLGNTFILFFSHLWIPNPIQNARKWDSLARLLLWILSSAQRTMVQRSAGSG